MAPPPTGAALGEYREQQSRAARDADEREAIRVRVKSNLDAKHLPQFARLGDLASVITGVTGVRCDNGQGLGPFSQVNLSTC